MADKRVSYYGNIQVGDVTGPSIPHAIQLPFSDILKCYTHLVIASGCPIPNLHPALPLSERVLSALSVVHWYTQHPTAPDPPPLDKASHVSIIGQGNVALDVARMLLTSPDILQKHDVPEPVLDVLRRSAVRHVSIIGRRGPLQAAFTTKEVRELMNISDASMAPIDPTLLTPPAGTLLSRQQTRVLDLLRKGSSNAFGTTKKTWSLDFFRSPTGLSPPHPGQNFYTLSMAHNTLDEKSRAIATGETSSQATDLIVTALGHQLDPATPFFDITRGHLSVDNGGRVLDSEGKPLKNIFASGWASMGARGVLASTMMDAYNVADTIAWELAEKAGRDEQAVSADECIMLPQAAAGDLNPPSIVQDGLALGEVTSYEDWKLLDAEEIRRGTEKGKERERMSWADARKFLDRA
jgi:adrenodoxin-NADP+ reductase